MVLNNYKSLAVAKHFYGNVATFTLPNAVKITDGTSVETMYLSNNCLKYTNIYQNVQSQLKNGNGIGFDLVIGKGNTTPANSDYQLENELCDGISFVSQTLEVNSNVVTITKKLKNSTGSSITVKEIGVKSGFYVDSSTTKSVLLTRDVLSSPLTVPDQKIFIVVATITLKI